MSATGVRRPRGSCNARITGSKRAYRYQFHLESFTPDPQLCILCSIQTQTETLAESEQEVYRDDANDFVVFIDLADGCCHSKCETVGFQQSSDRRRSAGILRRRLWKFGYRTGPEPRHYLLKRLRHCGAGGIWTSIPRGGTDQHVRNYGCRAGL